MGNKRQVAAKECEAKTEQKGGAQSITPACCTELIRNLPVQFLLAACLLFPMPGNAAQETVQVEANHMRWENHDAVLKEAIAWQEEREGHWVTVVLATDRPVARETVSPGKPPSQIMEEAGAQGIAVAVMSGGVPMSYNYFDVGYRNGDKTETSMINGAGGFEIESQSATRIKGRVVLNPVTFSPTKDANAWSVNFDAPVLFGDAQRMDAEGELLGTGGGQPGKDLQTVLQAQRTMDVETLAAYATPEFAAMLKDPAARAQNLQMFKSMTATGEKILGGLRSGDSARIYWVQQWPGSLDNRCVDTLVLQDGKWRSTESICQAE